MNHMKYVVSCIAWVEALLKKEIERLWYEKIEVVDRMVSFEADLKAMARINLASRVGNKVYLELASAQVYDFDNLFDCLNWIDWRFYLPKNFPLIIKIKTIKSELSSVPAIQKISTKAILTKLTWSKFDFYKEDNELNPIEIFIFIKDDILKVLLNTTGEALHKRWYREWSHEAPIKESLAASLVLLSNWDFRKNFYDFFCWSWTIAIEAALIAKNIAPWLLGRKFAFKNFSWVPESYLKDAKNEAESKIMKDKTYSIIASDIDEESIEMALINAKNAWVDDIIKFEKKSLNAYIWAKNLEWTLVSNPPYGLRLNPRDLDMIYNDISTILKNNKDLWGWIITSYEYFDKIIDLKSWKKRKLYNWKELCYFYKKI